MACSRHLKCRGCDHVWQGPWDMEGGEQVKIRCPKCGSAKVRPLNHPEATMQVLNEHWSGNVMGSENLFEVVAIGEEVRFAWRMAVRPDIASELPPLSELQMPRALAVNLAAWLALIADPTGKEFERIGNAIRK